MRPARSFSLHLVLALVACGSDSGAGSSGAFPPDVTCGLALSLRGAFELRIPPSSFSTGCSTQTSFDSGFDIGFVLVESDELAHVSFVVAEVQEGQTGSFPVELRIVHEDEREWRAECTAEIVEHEHVGPADFDWERYHVTGTASCDAPAPLFEADGPALELQELSFVVEIVWG
jgi:hypothetical protein